MNKKEHEFVRFSQELERLLNDNRFLLWCIAPDKDLDLFWNDWLLQNPEKKESVHEAKKIVQSMRLNNYRLSAEESEQLQTRLHLSLKKRRAIRRQWFIGIAASLLLLISLSLWRYILPDPLTKKDVELFDISQLHIDESQTEIELFVRNQEKFLLPNEAKIKLESSGNIQMEDAKVDSVSDQKLDIKTTLTTNQKLNTLKVPNGRRSFLTLSDGTDIWVNAGTVLSFPSVFEDDIRTIKVSGEIYLEVAKDTCRPFIIQTSQMEVEVLGTSFNVRAYSQDKEQSVVLVEGLVAVHNKNGKTKEVQPNTKLILSESEMKTEEVNVYSYISWRDGVLHFEGQNLGYVISCLSRYYNLRIECDTEIENFVCSGKLVLFNDVVKVMNTLEKSFPITCELNGSIIKLNNKPKK